MKEIAVSLNGDYDEELSEWFRQHWAFYPDHSIAMAMGYFKPDKIGNGNFRHIESRQYTIDSFSIFVRDYKNIETNETTRLVLSCIDTPPGIPFLCANIENQDIWTTVYAHEPKEAAQEKEVVVRYPVIIDGSNKSNTHYCVEECKIIKVSPPTW